MSRENLEGRILENAAALLCERGGAAGINLREVAKRTGCAHTNIYNYFPTLEHLKWRLLEESLAELEAACFPAGEGGSLLEAAKRYCRWGLAHPAAYKLIWITDLESGAAPGDLSFLSILPSRIRHLLEKEKPELSRNEGESLGDLIHSYLHGKLLNLIFRRETISDEEEVIEGILQTCRTLLALAP